jgi:pyruvate-ferredoxin/flavodoxin oxidoreductase
MIEGVINELKKDNPKKRFNVGIDDDVTHTSIDYTNLNVLPKDLKQFTFWGLGSDGTIGACKNIIKTIGK